MDGRIFAIAGMDFGVLNEHSLGVGGGQIRYQVTVGW